MHYLCVPLFSTYTTYTTITTTVFACSIFFSAYYLFASNNTCPLDLYSGDLQTTTVLFTHNSSSHKTDRITTTCRLLFLALLQYHTIRKQNVNVLDFSRTLSRFHCCLCIMYTLIIVAFACLSPSLSHCCCWFTCITSSLQLVVQLLFILLNVKRWPSVFIFITIGMCVYRVFKLQLPKFSFLHYSQQHLQLICVLCGHNRPTNRT